MEKMPELNIMFFYNQTHLDLTDPYQPRKGSAKFPMLSPLKLKEDFSNKEKKTVATTSLLMKMTQVEDFKSKL